MIKKLTIIKALIPFLTQPEEKLHLAEIARQINIPSPTTRLWLNELVSEGVLERKKIGRQTFYGLNKIDSFIIQYLCVAEKQKLMERCEDLWFRELVEKLQDQIHKADIILVFGSSVADIKNANDIDILVIGGKIETEIIESTFRKEIHQLDISFRNISDVFREELIKKHIIISGAEKFLRWMLEKDSMVQSDEKGDPIG